MGAWEGREQKKEKKWEGREEDVRDPKGWFTPMSKILKNTLIAELIWLMGAATPTIAPGGKHPRAATVQDCSIIMHYCPRHEVVDDWSECENGLCSGKPTERLKPNCKSSVAKCSSQFDRSTHSNSLYNRCQRRNIEVVEIFFLMLKRDKTNRVRLLLIGPCFQCHNYFINANWFGKTLLVW